MNEIKRIKKKLKFIKKNGDLYDAISLKKNATPDSVQRKLIKTHTLVFSRLMYLFLVLTRRCKNALTPVNYYKNIQEELRNYIGLPIDIYRTKDVDVKKRLKKLGIIYGNYNAYNTGAIRPSIEDLTKDLEKILDFSINYNIDEIYIDEFFLRRYLGKKFLNNYTQMYLSDIMRHTSDNIHSYLYIKTNPQGLKQIIEGLHKNEYDNEYIYQFKGRIKDQIINDAIDTFEYDNDIHKLLNTVKVRLNRLINDDGVTKDRSYGKIHQNYELGGPYLRVIVKTEEGKLIGNNIISLYNYLDIPDFSDLEERSDKNLETQELDLISLLYLHLIGETPKEVRKSENINSLYDYIYEEYQSHKKRIPWIKTRSERLEAEIPGFVLSFYSVVLAFVLYFLLKDVFPKIFPSDNPFLDRYNSFFDGIESLYGDSSEFERNILNRLKQFVESFLPKNLAEEVLNYSQEELSVTGNAKVAEIEWFTDEEMPLYFASQYATSLYYRNGSADFYLRKPVVGYHEIVDCEPLFQIKTPISKSEFSSLDEENMFHIPLDVYPIGEDYALNMVIIKDEADESKYVIVNALWVYYNLWDFTNEEKEILKSMENPFLYYVYGKYPDKFLISDTYVNYSKESAEDIKNAITSGLGLDVDATNDEINEAIFAKDYTKYPLYTPRIDTEELEYYEKIASLDAIDLDMASILTTMANEGYIYTVGYKNSNQDNIITTNEAYVWVMNLDGEIIDFIENFMPNELDESDEAIANWQEQTEEENESISSNTSENDESEWNSEKEESKIKQIFASIIKWAKEHHVSYILASILALLIINHTLGRKIRLQLKFNKAYKVLNDEDIANTYSELMKYIYGYESIPIKRTRQEMIDLIYKEFYSLNNEDIDSLINELSETIKENNSLTSLKKAQELLRSIPFIKERKNELKSESHKGLHLINK